MDERKSNASASGGKKEGNFFTKTAQSIREKVQGLKSNNDAKKNKQEKKQKKKNDKKSKTLPTSTAASKTDSGLDSDDDVGTTKSESSPPTGTHTFLLINIYSRKGIFCFHRKEYWWTTHY